MDSHDTRGVSPLLLARAALGGLLMGLANLVPGISGGTMLLAAGVYPAFIDGVAELTSLRLRLRPLALVGTVAAAAALAILLLAGSVRLLVVEHRWVMYSLFIGLTLGGAPLVWRMLRPPTPAVWAGVAAGLTLMLLMIAGLGGDAGGERSTALLLLSGLAGASAMILPGVSGGYLLLLLGQYEVILGAIDAIKRGLLAAPPDVEGIGAAMGIAVPVGVGVLIGVVGVSHGLRWLLRHHAAPTLGALLGLLLGAVIGLWPFQQPRQPRAGELHAGRVLDAAQAAALPRDDWPLERFRPSPVQVGGALGLIAAGLGVTLALGRLGGEPAP